MTEINTPIREYPNPLEYESFSEFLEKSSPLFYSDLDMKLLNITYSLKGMNKSVPMTEDNRFRTDDQISESIYKMMESY